MCFKYGGMCNVHMCSAIILILHCLETEPNISITQVDAFHYLKLPLV